MKKSILPIIPLIVLAGCTPQKKTDIVTTSFVSYDLVKNIIQEAVSFTNVVPWGSEFHSFEPTPQDILLINEAKLFVYTSEEIDTWVKTLVHNSNVFDMSTHFENSHDHHDHEEEDGEDDHNHASLHYWTNPHFYLDIMDNFLPIVTSLYPEHSDYFVENAASYTERIENSITELRTFLDTFDKPTIYFAGHNANDAFADEFGLTITSLSDAYKPDVDFDAKTLAALINEIKENDIHYLFVEELAEPRAALTIKNELAKENYRLEIRELHGYHNITSEQAKENVSYAELFERNVRHIKEALSYHA